MLPFAERSCYYPTLPVLELRDWINPGILRSSEVIDTADFLPAIRQDIGNTAVFPLFLDRAELAQLPGTGFTDPRYYLSVFWTMTGQSLDQSTDLVPMFTLEVLGGEQLILGSPDGVLHRFVGNGRPNDTEYPGLPAGGQFQAGYHATVRIDSRYLQLVFRNAEVQTSFGVAANPPTSFHLGAYLRVI